MDEQMFSASHLSIPQPSMQCLRTRSVTGYAVSALLQAHPLRSIATISQSSLGFGAAPVPTPPKTIKRPQKVDIEHDGATVEIPKPRRCAKVTSNDATSTTTSFTAAEVETEQAIPTRSPTRTRKKYEDLPAVYSPTGSPAPALAADWRLPIITTHEPLPTSPIMPSEDGSQLLSPRSAFPKTQLANDIMENLSKFPHCILLTRVGNFYESYFDQAIEVAQLLTIKLTTRSWGGQRVPMCGFPLAHLDRHLKRLVQVNKRFAAVCEEFKKSDGTFERRVVRVVTPGTLIDESFVDHFENNYLLAVSAADIGDSETSHLRALGGGVGLAWTDVATGEFYSQTVDMDSLRDEIARIGPREVVLPSYLRADVSNPIRHALAEEETTVSYIDLAATNPSPQPSKTLASLRNESTTSLVSEESKITCSKSETTAIALLTGFLKGSLLEHMPRGTSFSPTHQNNESRMQIDAHTIKALELREASREGGVTGSLMSVIKRTVTSSGARLLGRWLCSPSTVVTTINSRQALVAVFLALPHLRNDLIQLLKQSEDATCIVQKFLLGKGDTEDLLAIRDTIRVWNEMREMTESELYNITHTNIARADRDILGQFIRKLADLQKLASKITLAVDESVAARKEKADTIGDVGNVEGEIQPEGDEVGLATQAMTFSAGSRPRTIKPQFSPELEKLHGKLVGLQTSRVTMEQDLQTRSGAFSLVLGSTMFQGWHVRVNKAKDLRNLGDLSELGLVEVSKSASSRTYLYAPWTALGTSIMETESAIYHAEKVAFASLRREVNNHESELRRNARIGDELDVALAFANLAEELNLVRPTLDDSNDYHVTNGRHPTVELGLLNSGRNFVPNSVHLHPKSRLHVITGPNMAGKSTLLRQTALIAILAQTGSFVPAEFARIGIVDKVFSRIGAKDDLYRDRSTFMVEMLETAEILRKATDRSLVIMDEVGRGTTVKDGLAIAFATIHHLYTINKCRTLFATHFHDLADMLGYDSKFGKNSHDTIGPFPDVDFYCTDVDQIDGGYFTYSHSMRQGVNRDSHGLKVAQMAGMPADVIAVASQTLKRLEEQATISAGSLSAATLRNVGREPCYFRPS
ncbi:DNA mismatch repair ATPase msh1 [Tulasnella sp. JGI-2019a]|nr:DNA mismatch repair ATPase msh1 [Tulasnella sp. JGI-2019a]